MAVTGIKVPWDGWKLVRPLGHGSYGKVYEIEKTGQGGEPDGKAAMKVITIESEMLDDIFGSQYDEETARKLCGESLRNIRREYDLMYELRNNPNIVRCDDMQVLSHDNGIGYDVYIMMELLTPLQKVWKTGESAEEEVLRLGEDICRALCVCEQHKIIHRDIKPQNILVTDNGTYKLGDFGTARSFEHTASATMAGTETYMAPEVVRREKYGRDVDTYSLGLVMYRMLNNGQLPFMGAGGIPTAGERARSFQRRISGEPLPEPATGSRAIKEVVLKACAYDRNDRYSSAYEMLDDIIMAGETTLPFFMHDDSDEKTVIDTPETGEHDPGLPPGSSGSGFAAEEQEQKKQQDIRDKKRSFDKRVLAAAAAAILVIIAGIIMILSRQVKISDYSYAGISFNLPEGWEETSWHEDHLEFSSPSQEWMWRAPNDAKSEASVMVACISRESNKSDFEEFYKEGIQALAEDHHDWMEDDPDYEILDKGSIEIDGVDCSYVEFSSHNDDESGIWDYVNYDLYIPLADGQQAVAFSFDYRTGSGSAGKDDYQESEFIEQDRKLRDKVIGSIRLEDVSIDPAALPDYEESVYSREGITLTLPDEWTEDRDYHAWLQPDWSDLYVRIKSHDEDSLEYERGAKGEAESTYEYRIEDGDYTDVKKGSMDIDGVTCWYVEWVDPEDYRDTGWYKLYIPLDRDKKLVELSFQLEEGGIFTDRDKELRSRILNSIHID